jgi:hypothetical protein
MRRTGYGKYVESSGKAFGFRVSRTFRQAAGRGRGRQREGRRWKVEGLEGMECEEGRGKVRKERGQRRAFFTFVDISSCDRTN